MPPPPAKTDIATAILTNVIEHSMWLIPPNKARLHHQSGVGGFEVDDMVLPWSSMFLDFVVHSEYRTAEVLI